MSAFPSIADIIHGGGHVSFVPEADKHAVKTKELDN
jgi:hypothetical protein